MIKLSAEARELFEGQVAGGIVFWHQPGSRVVLFQTWEHRASGRVYSEIKQSWTSTDLVDYFNLQGWSDEYKVTNVEEFA